MSIFIFFMILPWMLCGEPIHVQLSNAFEPAPFYLAFKTDDSLDKNFVAQIEKVLRFDIANNGKSILVKNTPEMDQLLFNDPLKIKQFNHSLIVKIENKTLFAKITHHLSGKTYNVDQIVLKGNLETDRRQIHRLSDKIMKTLFDKKGIAQTHILFTLKHRIDKTHEIAEVWESDYDGANAHKLTRHQALCVTPSTGKHPNYFLFVSYQSGQPKIYLGSKNSVSITTSDQPFVRLRGQQMMPVVSPDQKHLVFVSDVTGNPDLFLIDIDKNYQPIGKPRQIYGTRSSTQGSPTFSPDSKRIAFVSNQDGIARIYTIDLPPPGTSIDKITPRLITKRRVSSTAPAWSPDGTKIAYSSSADGFRQIWVYDQTTGEERQLTKGPMDKENPSWAPDSLHLIYNAGTAENDDLYLIDLNQRKPVKITQAKGSVRFPHWLSGE